MANQRSGSSKSFHGGGGKGGGTDVAALLKPPAEKIRYFVTGSNDKPALDRELVGTAAEERAQRLTGQIDNTQLRRFYTPVVSLRDRAVAGRISNEDVQAELALLKARVAYAHKRPGSKVPEELVRMFTEHAASVKTCADFVAFARHFEAVVAYHRAFSER
jgi:CRISPR-associated protein Csm2